MLLSQVFFSMCIELYELKHILQSIIQYWLTAIGWALGLSNFLLPKPEDNGEAQAAEQERVMDLASSNTQQTDPE